MVAPDIESVEPNARDLDAAQRLAGVLFAFNKQQTTVAVRLGKAGVDRTAIMLLKTLAALGPSRSGTLADAVHSDPSTISRQVAALVKDGMVERRADPDDGRATLLAPTEAGLALLMERRAQFARSLARMVGHWDPADLDSFIELFERFISDHEKYLPTLINECATTTRSEGGNE